MSTDSHDCIGNMAFLLENAFNGSALVQDANNHPELRYMTTRKTTSGVPLQELIGPLALKWSVANNISVSDDGKSLLEVGAPLDDNWLYMSAVCYLYGLNIHLARKVPVGLINTNWGGTAIQDWSSAEAMAKCSHLSDNKEEIPPLGHATHLFNAMISPLLNHTIKGVVWYQGESNGGAPVQYGCQQPALVSDWREKWHAGSHGQTDADFAFGICEIAPVTGDPFGATGVRWFQTGSVTPGTAVGHLPNSVMPNTFMAVTIDLGDSLSPFGSVHPRYKTEVGARLALAGRALAYGDKTAYSSPVFNSASASSDGSEIVLKFDNTGSEGLELRAMNISKKFDQGNWTGATPFEVCMPSGGSLKPDLHCAGAGALEVGGDLRVDNMTLSAATKWCSQNSSCVGFTAQASSCSAEAVTKVYFKKQVTGKNVDTKWVNYQKSTPCGILSRYEDWSLAPNVKLGPNGDSIILSGMTLSVAAVRYAWRSYPCEHLGCGVYAKAENLPPPAFWAEVK